MNVRHPMGVKKGIIGIKGVRVYEYNCQKGLTLLWFGIIFGSVYLILLNHSIYYISRIFVMIQKASNVKNAHLKCW